MILEAVLQSALAEWEALKKVEEAAREVLPDDESRVIVRKTRNGATRTLEQLDEYRKTHSTPSSAHPRGEERDEFLDDEPEGIRTIREVLQQAAAGGE